MKYKPKKREPSRNAISKLTAPSTLHHRKVSSHSTGPSASRSQQSVESPSPPRTITASRVTPSSPLVSNMAEESRRPYKKFKKNISHDYPYLPLVKNQKTPAPKITSVATKILLGNARNFVCSPFSLEIVLGMLAFGATGQTLEQILEFLGHETLDQLRSESPTSKLFAQILENPNGGEGGPDINLANRVWVAKKETPVRLLSSYKEVLNTVYNTKARFVDFKNAPKAVQKINSWARKKTKGLIPTVLTEDDLTGKEDLVFANALYFKGIWSNPFKAYMTTEKKFKLINGKTILAPFMTNYEEFHYGSFSGYLMLKIPYESKGQSNKFSMYIFLPDRKDGLQDLLQMFHSDNSLFYGDFNLEKRKLDGGVDTKVQDNMQI